MRLEGRSAFVVGVGQSPGEAVGTGRAAAIVFAREEAKAMLADRDLGSARKTAAIIAREGGSATRSRFGRWVSRKGSRSWQWPRW